MSVRVWSHSTLSHAADGTVKQSHTSEGYRCAHPVTQQSHSKVYTPKEMGAYFHKKTHARVFTSFIHNSQKLETVRRPANRRLDTYIGIYLYNRILHHSIDKSIPQVHTGTEMNVADSRPNVQFHLYKVGKCTNFINMDRFWGGSYFQGEGRLGRSMGASLGCPPEVGVVDIMHIQQ